MTHNLLVVDDEPKLCDLLSSALSQDGIQVFTAGNGLHALKVLEQEEIDLVISDWRMPGMDGPQLLAEVKQRYPQIPVIVMTAYSTVKNAVQSMRNGAYDYIAKPFDIDELDITVSKALQFRDILKDNQRMRAELDEHRQFDSLVGDSPTFRQVLQAVDSVRESNATILLTGESGTGKEMVARAIHQHGNRANKPFVAVNCAAIPEGLLESEMFGHRKGAFTGAVADRVGRFQQADKGTLFLDEVGDMPLALQAKILRALQERVIEPVGDPRERKVDVRVIAATNKNLLEAVANKEFREDLYYRLNVFPIPLPALRERVEDIAPLARHFAHTLGATAGKRISGFSPQALQAMANYSWPGNIRELQNCVERATIVASGAVIEESDLPGYLFSSPPVNAGTSALPGDSLSVPSDLDAALAEVEKAYILAALQQSNGVQAAAAQLIGISERSFWYRLKKLGIQVDKIIR
ncbi:Two component, Sigma-54 Specific, central transcriptional regulator of acidic amino acid uptake [Pseudomonas chlororaphis subsp. aurantiaca]|uniref:sigma-54-dependent transcriptional regulator n=1 Tax=Pseudomonas chlororaphis TaxID=587753 RepID=UPI000F56CB9E|nr:sigma-54 dependent transcriptional regulator [Pseudomonas chlororaphis]AZD37826.1 Two component, Sigma-54 Specific, central transcriptional regulator of acidic amino acid uptake [Pseudomonas chlororaphis subsp. aurantiaca]AZD44166.1 Two component, Sigma-54 Specific, central transcriptional regulator of acidic amino acid uptake [Pseudomonas chlororaphis subsp. aurantiaca]QQX57743.1 sigma-54-dependent Fis family transcriptional regulator [Pseudomonas chlororaphis subsp. aurantiaca]